MRAAPRAWRIALLAGIYVLASLPVVFVFVVHPGLTGHPDADFGQMVDGTAARPYVTRALVPFVVRTVTRAVPEAQRARFERYVRDRRMVGLFRWEEPRLFEYSVATLLFVACFAGYAFVLRRLAALMYGFPGEFSDLAPLIALASLPLCFRYYSYLYDPATLLLFSLAILYMVEDRTTAFFVTLALATLNKETSLLLVPLYAWSRMVLGRRRRVLHTALALLVWCAVRGVLELAFRDRAGALVETHLDHTRWFFTELPGRMWYALFVAGLLAAVVLPRWREKPRFLRGGVLITLLPLVGAAFIFGFADELRGYYEAAPFIYLLMLPTLYRAVRGPGPVMPAVAGP